jgi:hypothetical protein
VLQVVTTSLFAKTSFASNSNILLINTARTHTEVPSKSFAALPPALSAPSAYLYHYDICLHPRHLYKLLPTLFPGFRWNL